MNEICFLLLYYKHDLIKIERMTTMFDFSGSAAKSIHVLPHDKSKIKTLSVQSPQCQFTGCAQNLPLTRAKNGRK